MASYASECAGTSRAAVRSTDLLIAARAEALFTSDLSASCRPTREQVGDAIRRAVRMHGGTRRCAAEVAAAYGEHPETAAPRMRWARTVVESVYIIPGRRAIELLIWQYRPLTRLGTDVEEGRGSSGGGDALR